jgi:hypothetical protein
MNNRQANGRRRGRSGQQRQGGGNPNGGNGNRIDNRARGNAAQLLEKYKNLAADAQRQGDRVNTEYYLQFADHYFRVLSESRSRFEEQNQQRRQRDEFDGDEDEFEAEAEGNRDESRDFEQPQRQPRQDRDMREDREVRADRQPRQDRGDYRREGRDRDDRRNGYANGANGHANGYAAPAPEVAATAPVSETQVEEDARPRRRGRPLRDEAPVAAETSQGIDVAVLPPAFGADAVSPETADVEEAPKKPRRRRTKAEDAEVPVA